MAARLPGRTRSLRRGRRGFTLLEVMISLGILAVALLAIGDLSGGAVRMSVYGKQLTFAVQLARGKMLDIQHMLRKDGLSDFTKEYKGDFADEGHEHIRWTALVVKPEIDIDPNTVVDLISGGLGMDSEVAAQSPLGAGGPLAGMVGMQVQAMSETLKNSVREVRLTVSWKNGRRTESFDVVEHIVQLPNATQAAAAAATPLPADAGAPTPATGIGNNPGLQQMGRGVVPGGAP